MSYQGYTQVLCINGHLSEEHCYVFELKGWQCSFCKSEMSLVNDVDDTNGESYGFINFNRDFILSPEIKILCKLNCEHVTKQAIYKIPTKEELEDKRTYCEQNNTPHWYWCKTNKRIDE